MRILEVSNYNALDLCVWVKIGLVFAASQHTLGNVHVHTTYLHILIHIQILYTCVYIHVHVPCMYLCTIG